MKKIPITIITGFLGSGKTTLLNHILNTNEQLRAAVLVNDFGEINIDSELITNVSGETISLANGCVCCTIRGDLINSVLELLERPQLPEHIIVEVSGVSDPAAAAMSFVMSTKLAQSVQIDSIVAVMDSDQFDSIDDHYRALAEDQICAADIVVLNKIDLANKTQVDTLRKWVHEISPSARILEAVKGNVPLELILGVGEHSMDTMLSAPATKASITSTSNSQHAHSHEHDHSREFSTWSWSSEEPLNFQAIYECFKNLDGKIFRSKGFLYLDNVPDKQVVLQMVGKRVTLSKGEPWGDQPPKSKIVVIGAKEGIDKQHLHSLFTGCLAIHNDSPPNRLAEAVINILRSPANS